jgi:hypothetical protein
MSFNLKKYLVENNLTLISRIREEEDMEVEPTASDIKKTDKQFGGSKVHKLQAELIQLNKQKEKIMDKFSKKNPDGSRYFPPGKIAAYKKAIGNIPTEIQRLQKQIKDILDIKIDSDEEDN